MVKRTENLKPIRSVDEAREKGKKGGVKSGEVRRERKALKEELICLLEQGETQQKISLALIKQALKGNVKAYAMIRDTIGEKPVEKQEITGANGAPLVEKVKYITPEKVVQIKKMVEDAIN